MHAKLFARSVIAPALNIYIFTWSHDVASLISMFKRKRKHGRHAGQLTLVENVKITETLTFWGRGPPKEVILTFCFSFFSDKILIDKVFYRFIDNIHFFITKVWKKLFILTSISIELFNFEKKIVIPLLWRCSSRLLFPLSCADYTYVNSIYTFIYTYA